MHQNSTCWPRICPQLLEKSGVERERVIKDDLAPDRAATDDRAILCACCGRVVTHASSRVRVDGKHEHVFLNPAGILFNISCWADAVGAVSEGEWTDEWSWFAPASWRYLSCAGCQSHLGWEYDEGFVGLITNRILESDD